MLSLSRSLSRVSLPSSRFLSASAERKRKQEIAALVSGGGSEDDDRPKRPLPKDMSKTYNAARKVYGVETKTMRKDYLDEYAKKVEAERLAAVSKAEEIRVSDLDNTDL